MTWQVRARLKTGVPARLHDNDDKADQDRTERRPHVGADSEEDFAGVDPDRLEEAPPDAVPDEIHAEHCAPLHAVRARLRCPHFNVKERDSRLRQTPLALNEQQNGDTEDVPDDLVQESGVEQCARW